MGLKATFHLNSAVFSIGYAIRKLEEGSDFQYRAEKISRALQQLADDIYPTEFNEGDDAYDEAIREAVDDALESGSKILTSNEPTSTASNNGVFIPSDDAYKKTSKVNYHEDNLVFEENTDDKIYPVTVFKSHDPAYLVGAKYALIFNTKTRALAQYTADGDDGLDVKGSTIYKFDPVSSFSKTLRKPRSQLNLFFKADRLWSMDNIKAVAKPLTGRINKHCVIIKVERGN